MKLNSQQKRWCNLESFCSFKENPVSTWKTKSIKSLKCLFSGFPQGPSFLSEALFPKHATKIEEMDPFFNLHETITKVREECIHEKVEVLFFQLANGGKENSHSREIYIYSFLEYTRKDFKYLLLFYYGVKISNSIKIKQTNNWWLY